MFDTVGVIVKIEYKFKQGVIFQTLLLFSYYEHCNMIL